jgi:hypothetical protein
MIRDHGRPYDIGPASVLRGHRERSQQLPRSRETEGLHPTGRPAKSLQGRRWAVGAVGSTCYPKGLLRPFTLAGVDWSTPGFAGPTRLVDCCMIDAQVSRRLPRGLPRISLVVLGDALCAGHAELSRAWRLPVSLGFPLFSTAPPTVVNR